MGKVIKLDRLLIERIAAGEVVERPASVVKELIENSIDAGADIIKIDISDAGLKKIRVTDNGIGMEQDDAVLALERYTTSKIKNLEDLERITTLGFRGEALASISAVSRMVIITRTKNSDIGTKVTAEAGVIKNVEPIGAPVGTSVTVYDLFFNAPARLKFLKSKMIELSHIVDVVTKYALIFPEISFELIHDGSVLISSPKSENILEKLVHIYGTDIARNMVEVDGSTNGVHLFGYTSKPAITRSTRKGMHIYVNRRFVISDLFYKAILDGYRSMFFKGRYPICVLNIDLDPSDIDVNVHPSKLEVKFKDSDKIFNLISSTVRNALLSTELEPEVRVERVIEETLPKKIEIGESLTPLKDIKKTVEPTSIPQTKSLIQTTLEKTVLGEKEIKALSEKYKLPWTLVGQVARLFIIAFDNENVYIIDQHAAHERILYESFLNEYESGKIKIQNLLEPVLISLSFKEALVLMDNLETLKSLGFDISPFGENSFLIRAVPVIMKKTATTSDLQEFIDELLNLEDVKKKNFPAVHKIISLIACKSAIKDNDILDHETMAKLIKDLHTIPKDPYHCPHGRPTILTIPLKRLWHLFKRT